MNEWKLQVKEIKLNRKFWKPFSEHTPSPDTISLLTFFVLKKSAFSWKVRSGVLVKKEWLCEPWFTCFPAPTVLSSSKPSPYPENISILIYKSLKFPFVLFYSFLGVIYGYIKKSKSSIHTTLQFFGVIYEYNQIVTHGVLLRFSEGDIFSVNGGVVLLDVGNDYRREGNDGSRHQEHQRQNGHQVNLQCSYLFEIYLGNDKNKLSELSEHTLKSFVILTKRLLRLLPTYYNLVNLYKLN